MRPAGFLQHGSIPLAPQHQLISRLFRKTSQAQVQEKMTDLESEGVLERYTLPELKQRLKAACQKEFQIGSFMGDWDEKDEAGVQEKARQYPNLDL